MTKPVVGYVPGVFDMFHIGHLNVLHRSRERCDHLIAGVVTDEEVIVMKGYRPIVPFDERLEIVRSIRDVDEAVSDHSADKRLIWADHPFDVLFKGSDWQGTEKGNRLEARMSEVGVEVVYLPYTEHTSSSMLRDVLERLVKSL
jgi:glycerol-3-phosphate cytidylyltransferase